MATAAQEAPPGEFFTRGSLDAPDTRGQSMVAKHLDKLQKDKEERAMAKLQAVMPQFSTALRAVALQECDWEEERAIAMLRRFQVDKTVEVTKLQKERKRHQAEKQSIAVGNSKRPRSGDASGSESPSSGSSSGSESNSSSDSDTGSGSSDSKSEDASKRKRSRRSSPSPSRRSKDKKRDGKKRKRSSRDKEDKKKKTKRSKKDSKDKKKKRSSSSRKDKKASRDKDKDKAKPKSGDQDWGKYGLIRETDMYAKRPEFTLWAMEVKKMDIDAMPKFEEKELFKSYMEDYNTGTLPHRKYYDQEQYERLKAAKAAKRGDTGRERAAFNDEEERKRELAAQRAQQQQDRLKQAYNEIKASGKAEDMREQELMRAKMSLAYRTGDQKEAMRLAERLKPDEK